MDGYGIYSMSYGRDSVLPPYSPSDTNPPTTQDQRLGSRPGTANSQSGYYPNYQNVAYPSVSRRPLPPIPTATSPVSPKAPTNPLHQQQIPNDGTFLTPPTPTLIPSGLTSPPSPPSSASEPSITSPRIHPFALSPIHEYTPSVLRSGSHREKGRNVDLVLHRGDDQSTPAYGRKDTLDGVIEVINSSGISEIEVVLEGSLDITFSERGLPYDQASIPVLSLARKLYSGTNLRLRYEFSFDLPSQILQTQAALPPSWHVHHPGAEADVKYQVKVNVGRKGFLKKGERLICKIDYFPRSAPPHSQDNQITGSQKKKDTELSYNLPPMNNNGTLPSMSTTTLTTLFSLPRNLVFASGSQITYGITFSCPGAPAIPALLMGTVSLLRTQTVILHRKRSSKETIIARGELVNMEFLPDAGGGKRYYSGVIRAGKVGEDFSWKIEGHAEVKYTIRLVVAPKDDFKAQFTQFHSLPTFEHREDITLTTDQGFEDPADASCPNPYMLARKAGNTNIPPGANLQSPDVETASSSGSQAPWV